MKKNTIKWKITLWYTGIVAVVILFMLIGMAWYISNVDSNAKKEELSGKTAEFYGKLHLQEKIYKIPDDMEFYDDGIIFSIYLKDGTPVAGNVPNGFPKETTLMDGHYQEIEREEQNWIVYDKAYDYGENNTVWIRAVSTTSEFEKIEKPILIMASILFVCLVLFVGLIGYRMVSKALLPVKDICEEASLISKGEDLSRRIKIPEKQDEMKLLAEEFNRMLNRLEESFEGERQFTSDVSHELRTPVAVIRLHCEELQCSVENEEEQEEIKVIMEQVDHIQQLISQLLLISRCERGTLNFQMEWFDFSFMVHTIADLLQEKAMQQGISIEINMDDGLMMYGEETLIMRMMINLVENAIFYGKAGGFVKISAFQKEDKMEIRVKDNGIGIAEENLKKIWNRFYREDKSRFDRTNGTGLGLSIVKWIVQIHHGTAEVKSKKGIGSEFIFQISMPEMETS